ncbi:hypothetical protein [Novosphingobium sp.]|uniref:hypothetical protein n=1 Tax=Novosphingobium sp. TaxID=1874826 RepID=UPI0035B342C2
METILFLAAVAVAGTLPALTIICRRKRLTFFAYLVWLGFVGWFLILKHPNPFGLGFLLIFLIGWLAAFGFTFLPVQNERFWGQNK